MSELRVDSIGKRFGDAAQAKVVLDGVTFAAEKGEIVSASWLGKTKTTLQDVAIILILLSNCGIGFFNFLNILYLPQIAMAGAIVFTLWSTADYLRGNLRNISTGV